jgi:uncharacterized protein
VNFEWDPRKEESNMRDHGVSFEEGATIFEDRFAEVEPDLAHSVEENRFICLGTSEQGRLRAVVFTERGNTIRIISAREATRKERKHYETQSYLH